MRNYPLKRVGAEISMELAKVTSKGQITIPISIREKLELTKDDVVSFYVNDDEQFVIEKYEQENECQHKVTPCIICLDRNIVTFSNSIFNHLESILKKYQLHIHIEWVDENRWNVYCEERPLTKFERNMLLKWIKLQVNRKGGKL